MSAGKSTRGNSKLWIGLVAMIVLAVGAIGYKLYLGAQAREDVVQLLEKDFAVELQRDVPDLGKLPARIQAVEDWEREPRLQRLLCRIYLAQSKAQQAMDAIDPLALGLTPDSVDAHLGALARMKLHAVRGGDPLLREALGMLKRGGGASTEMLFRSWQCAVRLGDKDEVDQLGAQLVEESGSTTFARLAKLQAQVAAQEPADATELADVGIRLRSEAELGPEGALEWEVLNALVLLGQDDYARALFAVEPLLARAPAVVPVRQLAATALMFKWRKAGSLDDGERRQLRLHLGWLLDLDRVMENSRAAYESALQALGPG